jgi:hypothetical protein
MVSISGPNGSFSMGPGTAPAKEGLEIAKVENKNTMLIAADGQGMHSLHAGEAGTLTFRFIKTSPTNQKLSNLYNSDRQSSALWGQNVISVLDIARGDNITASGCAFQRHTPVRYAEDGDVLEWIFDAIQVNEQLGSGSPSLI